jgi:hypothetical protein
LKIILLILLFGICSIGFATAFAQFPGSVKVYKYKPTMVPYVCGDKLIEGIDCQAEISPLMQYKQGITSEKISCKKGLVLVLKNSNNSPACIKSSSAKILVDRGWASIISSKTDLQVPTDSIIISKIRDIGAKPLVLANENFVMIDYTPNISITLSEVYGWDVMVFKGTGFRGLHVIDIIISNDQFEVELKTKTSQITGNLDMPWIIPSTLKSGEYDIEITDQVSSHHLKINLQR